MKRLLYYALMDARTSLKSVAEWAYLVFLLAVLVAALCVPGCLALRAVRMLHRAFDPPACSTSTDCAQLDTWSGRRYRLCPHESMEEYIL